MYSFILCLVVAIAVLAPINAAVRTSVQDIELHKLLSLLQNNHKNHELLYASDLNNSDDTDSSDDDVNSVEDKSRSSGSKTALLDIIKQIVKEKNNNDAQKYRTGNKQASKYDYNKNNYKPHHSNDIVHFLESLLGKDLKSMDVKLQSSMRLPKKRLTPNRLLGDVNDRTANDQNSRIYLILNPEAMEKSKDRNSGINKLVSRLLSLTSSASSNKDRKENSKQASNYYKGFLVNENIKRRRGSREIYGTNDSGEEKPKRGRGGNGSGHTAIPYIRHRGENIYERD